MKNIFNWLFRRKYLCYNLDNITGKLSKSYLTKKEYKSLGGDLSRFIFVKVPAVNYKFIHKFPGKNTYKLKLFLKCDSNKFLIANNYLRGAIKNSYVLYNTEDNKKLRIGYLIYLNTLDFGAHLIRLYPIPYKIRCGLGLQAYSSNYWISRYLVKEDKINIVGYI